MEYFYRKYEFGSEDQYLDLFSQIEIKQTESVIPLGNLRGSTFSVDCMWSERIPENLIPYEIWDVIGNGYHNFEGWDFHNQIINGQ
jgi:hypothetical protein